MVSPVRCFSRPAGALFTRYAYSGWFINAWWWVASKIRTCQSTLSRRNGYSAKIMEPRLRKSTMNEFCYSVLRTNLYTFGRLSNQGLARSSCPAIRNRVASSPSLAANITPIGNPSADQCSGTDIDGWPVIFVITANEI